MECPVSAIHFEGINYVIDPNKCTECGHCIEICPVCAIINDKKPQTIESHERLRKNCDLVVAGGGGSGMVAAVKYAQLTGGKVIVLSCRFYICQIMVLQKGKYVKERMLEMQL